MRWPHVPGRARNRIACAYPPPRAPSATRHGLATPASSPVAWPWLVDGDSDGHMVATTAMTMACNGGKKALNGMLPGEFPTAGRRRPLLQGMREPKHPPSFGQDGFGPHRARHAAAARRCREPPMDHSKQSHYGCEGPTAHSARILACDPWAAASLPHPRACWEAPSPPPQAGPVCHTSRGAI